MAVSSSFTGAKMENLLLCSAPTSSPSSSAIRASFLQVSQAGSSKRRVLVQKTGVRCDAAGSDKPKVIDLAAASLQFKANAADRYNREKSCIVVIGLSIHTTPVEMREKLAIPEAEWPDAISELCGLNHIEEAAVLSTCNRMEIYVVALSKKRGVKEVTEWMSKKSGIPVSELGQHQFILFNKDATQHLFEVASGLDSLVLGEGQILAQVKQVVKVGQAVNGFGRKISALFKGAITAGKRVRTDTNIASGAVSVSSAAVELALMKLPTGSHGTARMLLVGAGKMGKLVIKHLAAKGCTKIVVVNRSEERVQAIRDEIQGIEIVYKPLAEMLTCAAESDVIFTSTASETPLFLKHDAENLPKVGPRIGGNRLFVDISVPRNVGSCVSEASGTRVYNVDDLKEVVAANKEDRLRKAREAQVIIEEETKQFEAWNDSLETVPTIKKLRAYAEGIRSQELEKCFAKMGDDLTKKSRKAVDDLSRGIINKLLHGPMQHLRCDEAEGRSLSETLETMHALNRMYDLESDISLIETKIRAKIEQTKK